jgi:chitinase
VKVVASLGGGSGGTAFPRIAARDSLRAKFAGQVKKFLAAHALDGADLDWEPPTQADTASLRKMVRSLRDSLGPSQILSMAVYCSSWYGRWQPVERFVDALDWIGVMTYDITGEIDTTVNTHFP